MDGLLGQLRTRILGREGRAWAGSVEDLLFDGESVRRTVSLDDNRVVVTSHRLLAFTPGSDGENYRQVDPPNVSDVRAGYEGETGLVLQAVRVLLYGVVLLAVGFAVDFETFVPTDAFADTGGAAGKIGLGSLFGLLQQFLVLIASLDDIARAIGAVLVLFGVFVLAVYLLTPDRVLVVATAGDEPDITVPAGDEKDTLPKAVTALEGELFEAGREPPGGPETGDGPAADTVKPDDPL
jgi:hypothetical protein